MSGSAITGILVGVCGFVILLVGFSFWYRWRHRRSGIPSQEVPDAEYVSDDGNGGGEADRSTRLTPALYNAVMRHLTPSVVPFTPPQRPDPSKGESRPRTMEEDPQAGVVSQQVATAIPNVITPWEDTRNARIQVEGRAQDFGPIDYIPDSDEGILPPDYEQATQPFHVGHVE